MKIRDIYRKFGIPPNLQEHMLRVCAVASLLQDHWVGNEVDWYKAKIIALLHDLGNVVKFDLDKNPELLGEEQANIEHWKNVQKETIKKYGSDDHEATKKMLGEIGLESEAVGVILNKSFSYSVETEKSDNWLLKILYYADLRTLPFGIGTLEERIADVRNRMPKYTSRPDFEDLVSACKQIENQIKDNLDISVDDINNNAVNEKLKLDKTLMENMGV